MPFTLAHPGFIYHLKKWKPHLFSMEGLIIGSLVPDFDIIFRFTENRFHLFTFTPLNILFVIFPLSILTWLFYKLILQKTIFYIFDGELEKTNIIEPKNLLSVTFSLFISIIIHLFLDLFAHPDAYYCAMAICSLFNNQSFYKPLFYFFLYFPLVFSSILGFFLLFKQLKKTNYLTQKNMQNWFERKKLPFWICFTTIASLVFLIKLNLNGLEKGFSIDSLILFALSGFFYSAIISLILFGFIKKRQFNFEVN